MSDAEFFTVEGGGLRQGPDVDYPNYEVAFEAAQDMASASIGPLVIVRWTRTEVTKVQREISIKSEDMTKTKADATTASKMP